MEFEPPGSDSEEEEDQNEEESEDEGMGLKIGKDSPQQFEDMRNFVLQMSECTFN